MRTVQLPVSDGLTLVGDQWGDDTSPGVLLLHGAGQSRQAWKGTAAALAAAGYQALAVDARGHGDSEWSPQQRYEFDHMAADLAQLLQHFSSPPAVVGASMGGMSALNAQRLAGNTQLYAAVVLVDITPKFDMSGARRVMQFMTANPDGFTDLDEAADHIAAYNPHRPRSSDSSGLTKVLRQRDDGRWIWRWDPAYVSSKPGFSTTNEQLMAEHMERASNMMLDGAHAVSVPKLLVRGGQSDLVTLDAAHAFLESVPDAEFVDVAGTGHMVAGDDNDTFTAAVLDFLTRHHPPRSAVSEG